MKIIKYFVAAIILTISFSTITLPAFAQSNTPTSINYTPEVSIPGSTFNAGNSMSVGQYIEATEKMSSDLLSKYIQAIYNYSLGIVSILAAIVLMGGGLLWLTSGGDSSKVTKAKEMIFGSITGLVILFCAWIILNTVNPALLKLKPIETIVIPKITNGCCQYNDRAEMTTDQKCKENKGAFKLSVTDQIFKTTKYYSVSHNGKICTLPGCCITDYGQGLANSLCINSMEQECDIIKSKFVAESCQAAGGQYNCTVFDQCETAPNGSTCLSKPVLGESILDLCYNKLCWKGLGDVNEPCGNDPGATCTNGWVTTASLHPTYTNPLEDPITCITPGFKHDGMGGRSCKSGLACCYPAE